MRITIGDALTVVGVIVGILLSSWALTVAFALLFPNRAKRAQVAVAAHPWKCLGGGVLTFAIGMFIAVILIGMRNPITLLLGYGVIMAMIAVHFIGGSGISLLAAQRIHDVTGVESHRALEKSAALMVLGSLLPVFGWFVFFPIYYMFALGAGMKTLKRAPVPMRVRSNETVSATSSEEFVL